MPEGPKYPNLDIDKTTQRSIFKVSGLENHSGNGFWSQKPQIWGNWTLWVRYWEILRSMHAQGFKCTSKSYLPKTIIMDPIIELLHALAYGTLDPLGAVKLHSWFGARV